METGYHFRLFHLCHEGIQCQWSHYLYRSQSGCITLLKKDYLFIHSFSADINYNKIHKFINPFYATDLV